MPTDKFYHYCQPKTFAVHYTHAFVVACTLLCFWHFHKCFHYRYCRNSYQKYLPGHMYLLLLALGLSIVSSEYK